MRHTLHHTGTTRGSHWDYSRVAPGNKRQPVALAWEPVLEPVPHCTQLDDGWTRKFSFLVVLDKSWVRHYNKHRRRFASQGYRTLENSPHLVVDRVDYLFRKQFGVSIAVSKVVVLDQLEDACADNDGTAEGDDERTNTLMQLRDVGEMPDSRNANIIRLGAGSLEEGIHCDSEAQGDSLCEPDAVLLSYEKVFSDHGELLYESTKTLAHEIGHIFGICEGEEPHCINGHTANEFPDIMVWNGEPGEEVLEDGMLFKFLTTCTPVYGDLLCKLARERTCGTDIPPPSLAGRYSAVLDDDREHNEWHDVTVTVVRRGTKYKWENGAGVSWTLTRQSRNAEKFDVDRNSPYYDEGYTVARVRSGMKGGSEVVTGIYGPSDDLYERVG